MATGLLDFVTVIILEGRWRSPPPDPSSIFTGQRAAVRLRQIDARQSASPGRGPFADVLQTIASEA